MRSLALLLVMAFSLYADRAGPFVGASYGIAQFDSDARLDDIRDRDAKNSMRVSVGAYINEYFSVALDYTIFEAFNASYDKQRVTEEFSVIGVSAMPHYPLGEQWELYGRLGAGQIDWKESGARKNSSSAGSYILGAGCGYRAYEAVLFRLGYEMNLFELEDAHANASHDMRLDFYYLGVEVMF